MAPGHNTLRVTTPTSELSTNGGRGIAVAIVAPDGHVPPWGPESERFLAGAIVIRDARCVMQLGVSPSLLSRAGLGSPEVLRELSRLVARWFGVGSGVAFAVSRDAPDSAAAVICSGGGLLTTRTLGALDSLDELIALAPAEWTEHPIGRRVPPPEAWIG